MNEDTHEVRELRRRVKELGRQNGRQGETIHRLRADLAEVRGLNSRIDRGELRSYERMMPDMIDTLTRRTEIIAELREKLAAATEVISDGQKDCDPTGGADD